MFTKFEMAGVFVSIAVVAVALGILRFKTDLLGGGEAAVVRSESGIEVAATSENNDIEATLRDSMTLKGDLTKLVVDDVKVGSGREVRKGDRVSVHYIGRTQDGSEFDNSYVRGEPFVFTVGDGKVIKGWDEGLIGMKVGGERILVIPPSLAYGDLTVGPIKANSTLVFSIKLVSIEE